MWAHPIGESLSVGAGLYADGNSSILFFTGRENRETFGSLMTVVLDLARCVPLRRWYLVPRAVLIDSAVRNVGREAER
jgi:hypothetical protein